MAEIDGVFAESALPPFGMRCRADAELRVHERKNGARYRVRTCNESSENQRLAEDDTHIGTQEAGLFADLALVVGVWPILPEALRAAVMAIVRTHAEDLSINRRTAEVATVRAPEGQSSDAGAKPEQPVCGQVAPAASLTPSAVAPGQSQKPKSKRTKS